MNRSQRCGICRGCQSKACGRCVYCQDSPQFGGPGVKKQSCIERRCHRVLENRLQRDAPAFKARAGCDNCDDCAVPDCQVCLVCLDRKFFANRYMPGAMCAKKRCNHSRAVDMPGLPAPQHNGPPQDGGCPPHNLDGIYGKILDQNGVVIGTNKRASPCEPDDSPRHKKRPPSQAAISHQAILPSVGGQPLKIAPHPGVPLAPPAGYQVVQLPVIPLGAPPPHPQAAAAFTFTPVAPVKLLPGAATGAFAAAAAAPTSFSLAAAPMAHYPHAVAAPPAGQTHPAQMQQPVVSLNGHHYSLGNGSVAAVSVAAPPPLPPHVAPSSYQKVVSSDMANGPQWPTYDDRAISADKEQFIPPSLSGKQVVLQPL